MIKISKFDAADYLKDPVTIAGYLTEAFETNGPAYICTALDTVARAKGMGDVAKATGLSRESLYKTFKETARPEFDTVRKVMRSFGVQIGRRADRGVSEGCLTSHTKQCIPNKKAPAKPGPFDLGKTAERSARIEFDDQMRLHLHGERNVRQMRDAGVFRGHLAVIDFDEVGYVALAELAGFQHHRELLGGFLDLDLIADLDHVARDVDAAAVHLDMAVVDELARGEHGGDELGAIHHGVETALEQADQVLTGVALEAAGFDIDAVELALADIGVIALQLLLGAKLHAEVGELALAALAVLAGAVFTAVDGALRAAPDILAHTAIDLVLRLTALGHRVLLGKG